MKKKLTAMFLAASAALAPALCAATTCITDVMLIGGTKADVNDRKNTYTNQGWTVVEKDLNAGAKGDYIYLLYKSASVENATNGFITGFYIKTGSSDITPTKTYKDRTYRLVPYDGGSHFEEQKGDLNSNAGGAAIHLYYTKLASPDGRAVTGIAFNSTQSGAVGADGGSEGYDLNDGCGGNTDYIYMHVTTAEVPYVSPVSVTDVVARQRWPWNGLVDIACTVSGIEWEPDGHDFAVAAVMDSSVYNATHLWVAKDGKKSFVWCVPTNGNYRLIWDARADLGPELYSNVVVRVTVVSGHARAQLWEGGPYWAMTNVGAEKPEDYGYYFWWGDTTGYRPSGTTFSFSFEPSNCPTYGKSESQLKEGGWLTDGGVLAPEHDAAQAHWGGAWRMPTKQDLDDLVNKCAWNRTTLNGVDGYVVRGQGVYESASIFLPCAGYGNGTSFYNFGLFGYYWSSVPYSGYYYDAWRLYFGSGGGRGTIDSRRFYGHSVRPVQGFTEALMVAAGVAHAGDSAKMVLDLRTERESGGDETLLFSSLWDGGEGATVTIAQDGVAIAENLAGEGEQTWSVPYNGTYVLSHTTYANGVTGKVETAWFVVTGKVDPPAVVSFDEAAYSADEGGTLEVVVKGVNAAMPSRAAVYISYLTAAAADLDLKNGAIDGVTPKGGLKFPLQLTWDAGDTAPKKILIPVKADKAVEGDETFVLQLAEFVGMGPGETVTAWATIADKNDKTLKPTVSPYKPKKGESVATNEVTVGVVPSDLGFAAGSGTYTAGTKLTMVAEARPGCAFVGWERDGKVESDKPKYQIVVSNDVAYTAKFAAVDYMCGLADPADGGKVTGSGFCPAGKKVTLKATANKNFTFLGWAVADAQERDPPAGGSQSSATEEYIATTASLVIDRTTKPAASSKTSTTISNLTESTTFYAVFEGDPLVSAIPVLDDGGVGLVSNEVGKVTGAGRYAPGKKVTLKATANKGFAFSGFFDAEGNLLDETRSASLSFEIGDEDVPLTARFVTVDADQGSIVASLNGAAMPSSPDGSPAVATNVWCGVYLEWPLASEALSQTTVKVSGLPSGLKFTAKDIVDSKTKQVTVPANTIYGAPTAASKTGKDGKPTPSTVKVTVTTAGKSSATYEIALTVDPLPEWAVGNFDGAVGALPNGTVSLTIATSGKISGKILESGKTWTLSAAWFDEAVSPKSEVGSPVFTVTVIAKAGKEVATNVVTVAADAARPESAPYQCGVATGTSQLFNLSTLQPFNLSWTAYQNLWKRADTKAAQPVFKKNVVVEYYPLGVSGDKNNTVKFTFKKDGAVSFSGKIGGVSVSGSAQIVWDGKGWKMTVYAPPKPTAKPPFDGWCETFPVKLTMDEQNIVTKVELGGEEPEMVQLWEGGPYWATKNIGAEKPEDSGYYFWWGDTIGYKWENEQFVASDGSVSGFSFSGSNTLTWNKDLTALQSDGWITSDGVLAPEHDAAHEHWGGDWRMPTYQEVSNIVEMCDWEESTKNGVNGWIVHGRGDYSANSIFLPWVGSSSGTSLYDFGSFGYYWSSIPDSGDYGACASYFTSGYYGTYREDRDYGLPIRPVQSPAE